MRLTSNYFRAAKSSEQYIQFLAQKPALADILSHPGTLQEIANSSLPLQNLYYPHSLNQEHTTDLIFFITQTPDISATNAETFKFPFVASQFFSLQMPKFLELVLSDLKLFDLLVQFLDQSEPLPVLAGYFSKACESLLALNTEKFLINFFVRNGHLKLTNNLGNLGLAELLCRILLKCGEYPEFYPEYSAVMSKISENLQNLDQISSFNLSNLIKQLTDHKSIEISGFLLKFLSKNSGFLDQSIQLFKSYIRENPEFIKKFSQTLAIPTPHLQEASLKVYLSIFLSADPDIPAEVQLLESILSNNLNQITRILDRPSMSQECLLALELIKASLSFSSPEISKMLKNSAIFEIVLNKLKQHPFCTFLHNNFLRIFSTVLSSEDTLLKLHIMQDLNLADYIIAQTQVSMVQSKNCQIRKGYIPHLFTLSNLLQSVKKTDFVIKKCLIGNGSWKKFVYEVLEAQNLLESRQLGGENIENFFDKSSEEGENVEIKEDFQCFSDVNFWKLPIEPIAYIEDL